MTPQCQWHFFNGNRRSRLHIMSLDDAPTCTTRARAYDGHAFVNSSSLVPVACSAYPSDALVKTSERCMMPYTRQTDASAN